LIDFIHATKSSQLMKLRSGIAQPYCLERKTTLVLRVMGLRRVRQCYWGAGIDAAGFDEDELAGIELLGGDDVLIPAIQLASDGREAFVEEGRAKEALMRQSPSSMVSSAMLAVM
jgi:hypothetical protein